MIKSLSWACRYAARAFSDFCARSPSRAALPIQDLIQFRFTDGGIYGGRDGKELFRFYRYYPPNTDVMTDEEIAQEIEQLCRLFDSLRCPFTMFGTDKIEDMSALKEYYRSLPRRYDHILADVVNEIESTETKSSAVQRAYYFIYKAQSEEDDIYTLIVGKGYKIDRVKNDEMAVLLRNYLVREFINVDIYTIAEEVKNYPNMAKAKPAIYNKEIQRRLCPNRIDFTRDHAEQSGLMRRTLMIKNFPAQIPPRALYTVASMRGTSFTMRMTPLQKDNARKLIDEQIRNKAVIGGKSQATEQMDAAQETMDIKNFYAEVTRNQNTIYSVNVYIEIYGKTLPIFDQNGTEKKVLSAQVEVEAPGNSTVWRHVYSLNASDCERLGVDRNYMKNLIALKADELAKAYNISPNNLRMVCSWHNKDFHPHLHFLVWSTDSREAFIPHREKETDKSAALNAATRKVKPRWRTSSAHSTLTVPLTSPAIAFPFPTLLF